jgi:hypothetical protein
MARIDFGVTYRGRMELRHNGVDKQNNADGKENNCGNRIVLRSYLSCPINSFPR